MRGKQIGKEVFHSELRITPACAGKTSSFRSSSVSFADHPRVCGENPEPVEESAASYGSPPRVRGKRRSPPSVSPRLRITPACAGKTPTIPTTAKIPSDHPRVCGENKKKEALWLHGCGSPPRVRGKHGKSPFRWCAARITPACAGKTSTRVETQALNADHPRVCGENITMYLSESI